MAISTSTLSSLGVGSGLDLTTLLGNLKTSEQQQLVPLQNDESSYNTKLSAYSQLTSSVTALQKAADTLAAPSLFKGTSVSATGDALTATGSVDAVPGKYSVSVTQLAQAQSLVSSGVADSTANIGKGGTLKISVGKNAPVSIDIASGKSSLSDIRDAINQAGAGVSASLINDGSGTPYRLVLSSDQSGADNQITVSATDASGASGTPLANLLNYNSATGPKDSMTQTVAAEDAQLSVNGVAISRSSNTVSDAIQGVTLKLSATTTSPSEVTTSRDNVAIKNAINNFISSFNAYSQKSASLTAYNGPTATNNGVLLGDSTTRRVQTQLQGVLNTPVSGTKGGPNVLSDIGISLQLDGTLKIENEDELDTALSSNPSGVAALFSGVDPTAGTEGGVAGALSNAIGKLTDTSGLLTDASNGLKSSIKDVESRITQTNNNIDQSIAQYRAQFVQLDTTIATLNSTKSYLTSQFSQSDQSQSSS